MELKPWQFLLAPNVIILLKGMFLDAVAVMLIITPIVLPCSGPAGHRPGPFRYCPDRKHGNYAPDAAHRPGPVRAVVDRARTHDRSRTRHIAFGIGPHMCIGMSLSRMQARITRQQLLRVLALCVASPPQRARWTNFGVTAQSLRLTGQ